jgi:hypothetical protein
VGESNGVDALTARLRAFKDRVEVALIGRTGIDHHA